MKDRLGSAQKTHIILLGEKTQLANIRDQLRHLQLMEPHCRGFFKSVAQCDLYMLGMAVFEPVLVGPRVHRPSGTGAGRSGR